MLKKYYHLKREDLQRIDIPTIKNNRGVEYLNIESGFDIETTSMTFNDDTKTGFMYIWMFGIKLGEPIYYGRTWEEFQELCTLLQESLSLHDERRLVIYVHNLSYEFQFMRKYFEWSEVFAVGERKPIKATTTQGIEFRDSYILSGFSLEKTAENLQHYKVEKLVGDLDYSLIRHSKTEMTKDEMNYCKNDIEIILAYIKEQIEQYSDIVKVPMTNTGRVRDYVRNNCYYTSKNHRKTNKGKYQRYRNIMNDLTVNVDEYAMLKRAFMGGFTHANATHSGKLLHDVSSIDFTSSYPAVMLAEQYPMSRGKKVEITSVKMLEDYCRRFCVVFDVKFTGLKSKIEQENYISESKCFHTKNATINNGRIFEADEISLTITNVDFDIMKQCYSWENISIANATYYHKGYLPKDIIDSVLKLYEDKTVLKDVEGSEVEYNLSKGMLNSVYGMSVTDITQDNHIYSDHWDKELANIEEQIDEYNKNKKRFLYYPWGVWITAYARRNLWTGIIAMGQDYIYSDTDSIKFKNYDKHKPYINWYNDMTVKKLEKMCEHHKIDTSRLNPKNKHGNALMIGIWDFEGTYSRFKTLGSKRYLQEENGKLAITVAGLSKQNGLNYMLEKCNNNHEKVFNMFDDELYIPADRTGKMTHTYIDDKLDFMVQDYNGRESRVEVESGIHLGNCEFTLSISKQYGKFLDEFMKGYVYKGVKHI